MNMAKKVSAIFFVLLTVMVGTAAAQDVKAVLQAAAKNMGADNLKTIQITGKGWIAGVGQSYSPADDWPRFEVTTYTRTIDYDAKSSREELTRRQGSYPARGQVIVGEQQLVTLNTGSYGWTMQGANATAMAPDAAEIRELEIWLTPHGFLKAAMAPNATPTMLRTHIYGDFDNGADVTIVSIMVLGKYRVNGTIAPDNTVQRVQTWIPNPVFGDLVLEHRYENYKTFGNVKVPGSLHSHLGNPVLHPGHNSQDIAVANIVANGPAPALAIPEQVRKATVAPVKVESSKLANGVYLIGGGTHNSVAVEFKDYVAVVEAPLNEERSLAVIGEVTKLVPNKPIKYIVNTHHHFDHSGGLRTFVAQSATIITHPINKEFYQNVLLYPSARTLQPDIMSKFYPWASFNRTPVFEPVGQKYVLSDGTRTMEIYPVTQLAHAASMLIAYLPAEKILINADLYSPPAPGATPPATPNPSTVSLRRNIQRLKLDVAQHVPIHGRVGTNEEFLAVVGKAGAPANATSSGN
jgi:glyoxylase-like metal-dependent hydrolase (beta-lactamase superfamily II)